MASRTRPFLMTGAALASAAAIVAASPTYLPTHDIAMGASAPLPVSTAKYELTAITDITIQGINDAYWFGWGGYIGGTVPGYDEDGNPILYPAEADGSPPYPNNQFFPELNSYQAVYDPGTGDLLGYYYNQNGIYTAGAPGVLYYLADNLLETFAPGFDLDNYYFEVGSLGGYPNAPYSGWSAVAYVGLSEIFGPSSPIAVAAQAVFRYGLTNVVNSVITSAAELFPTVDIGPVRVGGGILAGLFYNGATPDGSFSYSTNGLSAILAYISTSISDNLPGAPSGAALSGAISAAAAAVEGAVKNFEGALTGAASGGSAVAAKSTKTTAAAELKTESVKSGTTTTEGTSNGSSTEGTTTTEGGTSTGSTTEGTSASGEGTTESGQGTTSAVSGTSTSTATGTAAPKTTSSTKPTTKPAKPQNPLNKIGKRIADALGGGKKTKSESGSSGDSSSSSSSSGSSSSGSGDSSK